MAVGTSKAHSKRLLALRRILQAGLLTLLLFCLNVVWSPVASALPPGNAITDGKALLRYALPIDNKPIRDIQLDLENISDALRARRIPSINRTIDTIQNY